MSKEVSETPLMKQYNAIKAKYADAILLFRVGDFYETFSTDAITTAKVLGITLTKRGAGSLSEIELAGFPHHALDTYLPKLVKAGYRVAICDQLEDPKLTKTIVKRGVTELITPGVALNDTLLEHKQNNFLCSVFIQDKNAGVSFLDISTGEFLTAQGTFTYVEKLIQSFAPNEIIYCKQNQKEFLKHFGSSYYCYPQDEWIYTFDHTYDLLLKHFEVTSLKGFGIEELTLAIIASGASIQYVKSTEHNRLQHISKITRIEEDHYVSIDKFTIRNLEILQGSNPGSTCLVDVLDYTITPMGARALKRFLAMPLKNITAIDERLQVIEAFVKDASFAKALADELKQVGDLERLISKVSTGKVSPRDLNQLKKSLRATSAIKQLFAASPLVSFKKWEEQLQYFPLLIDRIEEQISEEAPAMLNKGNFIKKGANKDLDELRDIISNSKDYLLKIQVDESAKTGISSLKIGFNNVFGYYLEVTNLHKSKVPSEWIRKQTLSNAERYITEELKVLEQKILGAEEKIQALEESMFYELLSFVADYILAIQNNAVLLAKIDVLHSAYLAAQKNKYVRPAITEDLAIDIKGGRHPVIEIQLGHDKEYIANDVYLDADTQQIMMITGPNMSGKSAVLRQTALIVLMAQCGFYVPADSASIGIVDKIFTRVGASDNLSSGESTFMVEMNETASIVNNISNRSLILLDEIGRGTSTYDGISIAWSIAEFLHDYPNAKPKTLFATHYHELNDLAENHPRIKNYHVATKEIGDKVLFLRKLVEGGSEHSFGIHVAKMAGMPKPIIDRANELLVELEKKSLSAEKTKFKNVKKTTQYQLNIFEASNPQAAKVLDVLTQLNIDTLTPVDALWKLNELKNLLK